MMPILQMHLEILNRQLWTRCIELAWTVPAPDPRIVVESGIRRRRSIRPKGDREIRDGRDGGIAHEAFENVLRVFDAQVCESIHEVWRRRWL